MKCSKLTRLALVIKPPRDVSANAAQALAAPKSARRYRSRFVIASILAGVGLLALTWPAEAKIVYRSAYHKIGPNSSYGLDLSKDGVTDLRIWTYYSKVGCEIRGFVSETPASGNGVVGSPPVALNEGDQIGPSQTFYGGIGQMAWEDIFLYKCGRGAGGGPWLNVNGLYLGLMFQIKGEAHYGWVQLDVGFCTATLTGYAYETIADMPINAGQTQDAEDHSLLSPDWAIPETYSQGVSVTSPRR
jgi:hypothetical protein